MKTKGNVNFALKFFLSTYLNMLYAANINHCGWVVALGLNAKSGLHSFGTVLGLRTDLDQDQDLSLTLEKCISNCKETNCLTPNK